MKITEVSQGERLVPAIFLCRLLKSMLAIDVGIMLDSLSTTELIKGLVTQSCQIALIGQPLQTDTKVSISGKQNIGVFRLGNKPFKSLIMSDPLTISRRPNARLRVRRIFLRAFGLAREEEQNEQEEDFVHVFFLVKVSRNQPNVGLSNEPALREAFTKHKNDLVFMDFLTDQTANVYPMVAAGKGLSEMILAEEL